MCHSNDSLNSNEMCRKKTRFPRKRVFNKNILVLEEKRKLNCRGWEGQGWKYSGFLRCTLRKQGDNWCNQSGLHFCILIELLSWLVLATQSTIRLLRVVHSLHWAWNTSKVILVRPFGRQPLQLMQTHTKNIALQTLNRFPGHWQQQQPVVWKGKGFSKYYPEAVQHISLILGGGRCLCGRLEGQWVPRDPNSKYESRGRQIPNTPPKLAKLTLTASGNFWAHLKSRRKLSFQFHFLNSCWPWQGDSYMFWLGSLH